MWIRIQDRLINLSKFSAIFFGKYDADEDSYELFGIIDDMKKSIAFIKTAEKKEEVLKLIEKTVGLRFSID